jgi:hypothetical protein
MAEMFRMKRINGISDDAVKAKTGRKWGEWFTVLDKLGARMMEHAEITAYLRQEFGLTAWWCQTVSVGYEQERGMRQKHQRGTGYAVDVSKTMAAPLAAVWNAWQDRAALDRWLPSARFAAKTTTPNRIMHLTWSDGTSVSVIISEKAGRTKVVVSHAKLPLKADVERVRAYWSEALRRLKSLVEA